MEVVMIRVEKELVVKGVVLTLSGDFNQEERSTNATLKLGDNVIASNLTISRILTKLGLSPKSRTDTAAGLEKLEIDLPDRFLYALDDAIANLDISPES